jgi:hypothetical protein
MTGNLATNKQKYRQFCQSEPSIPIFSKDWWLDAVCGQDAWDVALVEKGSNILGTMPYYTKKRYSLNLLTMPSLTQTLGPWLRPSQAKYAKQIAEQKKIMTQLIEQLPAHDYFSQNFHYSITNWLPFYWQGFSQTTRYTYVLNELSDKDKPWDGLLPNIRTDIKKASNRYELTVRSDLSVDEFLKVNEKTFTRQGQSLPYTKSLVHSIYKACSKHDACKMFFAVDAQARVHAANFIIWDENSAYYLMGGGDPELRNSGATSLIMWEAIIFASTVTKKFDFEGSMIEPVEKFFRAFGATQMPYFQVKKTNSRLLKLRSALKTLIR